MTSNHQLADFLDHLGAAFARGEYPDDAIHTRRLKLWEAATALRVSSRVETNGKQGPIQRVCHALTENCVMFTDPERAPCTPENCAAMRASVEAPETAAPRLTRYTLLDGKMHDDPNGRWCFYKAVRPEEPSAPPCTCHLNPDLCLDHQS